MTFEPGRHCCEARSAVRWLITGGGGFLGTYLCRELSRRNATFVAQVRNHRPPEVTTDFIVSDLAVDGAGTRLISDVKPTIVIHCAAMTNVDECEKNQIVARRSNALLPGEIAEACTEAGAKLVFISTDQLWRNARPLVSEDEPVDPAGSYGKSKAEGERLVMRDPKHLVLRTNFFGSGLPWRPSLSDQILQALRGGKTFNGFTDVFYTPIEVRILSRWIVDAAQADLHGIYHLGGRDRLSKHEFAVRLARHVGLDAAMIGASTVAAAGLPAERPREMSLSSAKIAQALGRPVPSIDDSILSCLAAA
jgi:dTDP-4-dehydrorhamnose reductase